MRDLELILFLGLSAVILYVSRKPLRSPRPHGFYRFFAWEVILVMIVLNLDCWFCDPFSIHQHLSWLLLFICTFLVIHGAALLHTVGKPGNHRNGEDLIGLEKTTKLVTVGAYRYIRHPVYCSLLCLAWGAFFKSPSWLDCGLALVATAFLIATCKAEEIENERYFGSVYRDYMRRTKMLIPFLF